MKSIEEIDKEFTDFLWKMPQHWFSETNAGIVTQPPISYALYQAICMICGFETGDFDLAQGNDRIYGYQKVIKLVGPEKKKTEILEPLYRCWGDHKDDYKILRPIYYREKDRYLQVLEIKNLLIHLVSQVH